MSASLKHDIHDDIVAETRDHKRLDGQNNWALQRKQHNPGLPFTQRSNPTKEHLSKPE